MPDPSAVITPEDYEIAASILRDFAELAAVERQRILTSAPAQAARERTDGLAALKLSRFLETRAEALRARRERSLQ